MVRARQLAPVLAELKSTGLSARQMAAQLTARGISTPNGAKWHAQTVIRVMNRAEPSGNDLTARFPLIVEALARLHSRSCIIDGEAVACRDDGVASFDLIRTGTTVTAHSCMPST